LDEFQVTEPSRPPFGLWLLLLAGGIIGALMALAVTLMGPGSNSGQFRLPSAVPDPVTVGEAAPEFTGITSEGEQIALSDLRRSIVAINFWATWCAPCRVEMPALQEAANEGMIVVLAVNAGESDETVDDFMEELGLTFTAVLDLDG
jgi:thiol-disulfide isomerase/thioredoxin